MPFAILPAIPTGGLSSSVQPSLLSHDGELSLRPWNEDDVSVLLSAFRDPAIRRWHVRHVCSAEEALEWIDAFDQFWCQEQAAQWVITRAADGEALGRISLRGIDLLHGVAECTYWVLPNARGGGVAPRALTTLVDWAMDTVGFHRLELVHSVENSASCRVAGKAGFVLEGTRRGAHRYADGWHDMHLHACVR
ncbi:GNAT family N-acetyltransferase [Streptomyces niveus]|uniref:GNAT family N-acetyltransferase n=1 Tax=Streptomyces niveus TaxID=193462 RepID=UPI0036D34CB6